MADRAKPAATSVVMLSLGGSRVPFISGRHHLGTDRSHVKGIARGISDRAKCSYRCRQLHHNSEQHDWNENFQPPSHAFSPKRLGCPTTRINPCRQYLPRTAQLVSSVIFLHQALGSEHPK